MFSVRSKLLIIVLLVGLRSYPQKFIDSSLTIYFKTSAYTMEQGEEQKLDSFFKKYTGAIVLQISGHTDTVGNAKDNMQLSYKRSKYIGEWLKKYPGAGNYKLKYFGETKPVSTNDNALNRRVEIKMKLPFVINESADSTEPNLIRKFNLDNLYFEPDKAILEDFSLDYFNSIIPILKNYVNTRFEIRGHVNYEEIKPDSGYTDIMNKLSEDRAKLIYQMLIEKGIPANKMSYKGMGNTQMIYPHPFNEVEKRKNMRVEILVFKNE